MLSTIARLPTAGGPGFLEDTFGAKKRVEPIDKRWSLLVNSSEFLVMPGNPAGNFGHLNLGGCPSMGRVTRRVSVRANRKSDHLASMPDACEEV